MPEFVKAEFDAFLACGILAHGFLRLRCSECGHEKLVAFSCKRRGFCPSCGARRMAETAAHLVDCVIPPVPVRQWVLSLPIPLRLLFAAQPQLLAPLLQAIHRVIAGFLVKRAGFKLSRSRHRRGHAHSALRLGGQFEYPRIIPPLCNVLILFEQTLLFGQRVPVENELPRGFEPLQNARNRLTVQVCALHLQWRIGRDLFND